MWAIGLIGITKSAIQPFLSDKIQRILALVKDEWGSDCDRPRPIKTM